MIAPLCRAGPDASRPLACAMPGRCRLDRGDRGRASELPTAGESKAVASEPRASLLSEPALIDAVLIEAALVAAARHGEPNGCGCSGSARFAAGDGSANEPLDSRPS